jgi:hypothetical protein
MTSPARPWFRLTTGDDALDEHHSVKEWLSDTRKLMLRVFAKGNHYRALHSDLRGAWLLRHRRQPHHAQLRPGAAQLHLHRRRICHRHRLRGHGQRLLPRGRHSRRRAGRRVRPRELQLDRALAVRSRDARPVGHDHSRHRAARRARPARPDAKNMPFKSCYFEKGATPGKYLREGGLKRFRLVAPRWHAMGGDVYGNSPGMEALGDIKQLQHEQLRKGQGIDYQTKPPIGLPTRRRQEVDLLPGGVTFFNTNRAEHRLAPDVRGEPRPQPPARRHSGRAPAHQLGLLRRPVPDADAARPRAA